MKKNIIPFLAVFIFLVTVITLFFLIKNQVTKHDQLEGFSGVIESIKRTPRNFHILELYDGKSYFEVIDMFSRDNKHEYLIGDSLIKIPQSCIFYHKRGDRVLLQVHDKCSVIYKR